MSKLKNKLISKTSYAVSKSLAQPREREDADEEAALRALEEEVMWERSSTNKSDVVERNLTQMIDVLHLRLKSLESVVSVRQDLCDDDVNPNSSSMSKQAPKIADEYEDFNPRALKDPRAHLHKVSNNTADNFCIVFVFISFV
jgi:hypothetical protein